MVTGHNPLPLLQTVKLVHRSSVLGGCFFINYIIFSLIISSPNIYLINIPSSFSPHPSKHNQNKKNISLNHFVTFSSYRGNSCHKYFYSEVFLITKLIFCTPKKHKSNILIAENTLGAKIFIRNISSLTNLFNDLWPAARKQLGTHFFFCDACMIFWGMHIK